MKQMVGKVFGRCSLWLARKIGLYRSWRLFHEIRRLDPTAVSRWFEYVMHAEWPERIVSDNVLIKYLALHSELFQNGSWDDLDRIYSFCRRKLQTQPDWRCGPARVREVAKEGLDAIKDYTSFDGKVYCDLGCGTWHPYGISAVMFLNGAASTIALDLHESNTQRAAEALGDLICECLACPEQWHWSGIDRSVFLDRARQFDLNALRAGRLDDGLAGLPMKHILTDIHNPILREESIDIMTSRAVLEHFLDFEVAIARLFALTRKGGIAFHHIDLADHRMYTSSKYHAWSFLAEEENWSDGLVNRLRSCEIGACFKRVGFEVLRYEKRIGEMPPGFRQTIAGRFKEMPEEELNTTGVFCVLRKP